MRSQPRLTTDHKVIKKWVEEHGGVPASVQDDKAAVEELGLLRIYFPSEHKPDNVNPVTWDKFFHLFDQAHLAFVYEDKAGKEQGRFFKFVSRNGE
ncbi:MAG: hypothetical protein ACLFQB_01915 [Chitinispirillaceae bacterium]